MNLLACIFASVVILEIRTDTCPTGYVRVPGADSGFCYLVDIASGPVSQLEAKEICENKSYDSYLAYPVVKDEAEAIANWVVAQGVPSDGIAGFWTVWERFVYAPAENDGSVSTNAQTIRKDRNLFRSQLANGEKRRVSQSIYLLLFKVSLCKRLKKNGS